MKICNVQIRPINFSGMPKCNGVKDIRNRINANIKIEDLNIDEKKAFEKVMSEIKTEMKELNQKRIIDEFNATQDARDSILNV